MSRRILVAALALGACSSDRVTVDVKLTPPSKASLSPYDPSVQMTFLRMVADGEERLDESLRDLSLDERSVTFEGFPSERALRVSAEGYDPLGNLVAYGRVDAAVDTDDLSLEILFRRPIAYVTHRQICDGGCGDGFVCANAGDGHRCVAAVMDGCGGTCGASDVCAVLPPADPQCMRRFGGDARGAGVLYAIDSSSRALVEVIPLPAAGQRAVNVTNKAGEGVWVTLAAADKVSAVFLSSSDGTWGTPIDLPSGINFVLGSPDTKYVVAAGGGHLVVFDETTRQIVRDVPFGGNILDGVIGGGGSKAFLVSTAGLALLDLDAPEEANPFSPGDVTGASGMAISDDNRFAWVTSKSDGKIYQFDLVAGGSRAQENPFPAPVRGLVLSDYGHALLGIQAADPGQKAFSWSVDEGRGFPAEEGVGLLPEASGIAAGPLGRRVMIVSAGTSTGSSGLTIIDPFPGEEPTGSTVLYLRDPTDRYTQAGASFSQRYRPDKVAILYGQ